jgi:hypothetical protein
MASWDYVCILLFLSRSCLRSPLSQIQKHVLVGSSGTGKSSVLVQASRVSLLLPALSILTHSPLLSAHRLAVSQGLRSNHRCRVSRHLPSLSSLRLGCLLYRSSSNFPLARQIWISSRQPSVWKDRQAADLGHCWPRELSGDNPVLLPGSFPSLPLGASVIPTAVVLTSALVHLLRAQKELCSSLTSHIDHLSPLAKAGYRT